MKSKNWRHRFIFVLIVLLIWELAVRFGTVSVMILPTVQSVLVRFFDMLVNEQLLMVVAYSILMVFIAIGISIVLSILLILAGRRFTCIGTNVDMVYAIVSPLPGIAILPLVILWFGIGIEAMLFILVHATVWPMWRQLSLAVERLHKTFSKFEQVFKLPFYRRFYHIYCLGAMKEMKSALSVSWSRGWRALISVEMIFGMVGTHTGLGWLIYERRMYMDTEGLYAGLLAIAICGIIFESVIFGRARKGRFE